MPRRTPRARVEASMAAVARWIDEMQQLTESIDSLETSDSYTPGSLGGGDPVVPEVERCLIIGYLNDHQDEFAAKLMSEQPNSDNVSEEGSDSTALHLPLLVVAHGMDSDEFDPRDGHRLRMNLASAVKFLSSIGIYDMPIYGLYTEGTHSVVIVAWTTAESPDIVQIHDQNCVAYDIATWDGIVKLSKFLLWIRQEHAPYMLERFDAAKREEFLARLERGDPSVHWTAVGQRLLEHSDSDAPAEE